MVHLVIHRIWIALVPNSMFLPFHAFILFHLVPRSYWEFQRCAAALHLAHLAGQRVLVACTDQASVTRRFECKHRQRKPTQSTFVHSSAYAKVAVIDVVQTSFFRK